MEPSQLNMNTVNLRGSKSSDHCSHITITNDISFKEMLVFVDFSPYK